MKRAHWIALLAVVVTLPAVAEDAPQKPFKTNFLGEGGGYKHPDPATDQYLNGALAPAAPDAQAPAPKPAAPVAKAPAVATPVLKTPVVSPVAAAPRPARVAPADNPAVAAPRTDAPSRSIAARPAAKGRDASVPETAKAGPKASLWNGAVQPLDMSGDPAAARENADRDYEEKILGIKSAPKPRLEDQAASAAPAPAPSNAGTPAPNVEVARAESGKVFVSMELDPSEAGTLRDAVAGLGASVGFAADPRFEAMAAPGGRSLVSGWMPSARVGDAARLRGVKSIRLETRPAPSKPSETSGRFVIGLRLDDGAKPRESVDAGVRSLKEAAGFRLAAVLGVETAPDGRAVAVVSGEIPLSRLSKALALERVAKIAPEVGQIPAPSAAPASTAPVPGPKGFLRFVYERGAWLIVLTLLLALPSLRELAGRMTAVFNPYR